MGDSSFSDWGPVIDMPDVPDVPDMPDLPDLPSSSRNWSTTFDPFYVPLITSLFPSLHSESMLSTSQSSSQGSNNSSSSNPQRAPISDDQKIELMRLQERVGEDELPVDWERGFEELGNDSPRDNSNDSDHHSDRFGRSVYF